MNLKLEKPIVFFDLETTGVQIAKDRIVEISMLKILPNGNKESKTWLVNPTIPIPTDTTVAPFIHHNDMIAAKLINASDVSHVVKRTDWVSGTVYHEYDHTRDDLIDRTFFVMTDNYNVYKLGRFQ